VRQVADAQRMNAADRDDQIDEELERFLAAPAGEYEAPIERIVIDVMDDLVSSL
jgi:hypothetical protein